MSVPFVAYSEDQPKTREYSQGISITKGNMQYIVSKWILTHGIL